MWSISDANGYPAPKTPEGRALPLWSSERRAAAIIANVPAFRDFELVPMTWTWVIETLLPDLERSDLRVGVNWTGRKALCYDVTPAELGINVEAALSR